MTDWYKARCRENEAGAILIIYALILTTMIALAGFAVDFTRWSRIGTMEQRAADAAALAGAVYMPDDFAGAQTALAQASKNGFTNGSNSTSIVVARGVRNNQLRVTISRQVTNIFGSIVGAKFTTITKEALAEYQRAVNMGSPSNQFGNNPEASTFNSTTYPNFWGSVAGPNTDKVQGDAISSKPCTSSGTSASDNCSSSLNTEYDGKGYYNGVDVIAGATGPLTIHAYDPAFVEVGSQCGTDTNGSNLTGAAAMTTVQIQHYPTSSITPATRYNTSSTSKFCNGDQTYDGGGSTPTWTTFIVLAPDASPWDPTDNPVLCSKNFPG